MALINCRECGREMSDQATACPYCGYTSKENVASEKEEISPLCLGGLILSLFSIFIDYFCLISLASVILSGIGIARHRGTNRVLAIIGLICGLVLFTYRIISIILAMTLINNYL